MAYYNPRRWSLHCNSCKGLLGTHDTIMLAIVPPSQQHLSVKQGCEEIAAKTLRKIDVLEDNPKKSKRSLFRLLCQNCNAKVGSVESIEGQELMCLKSEAVLLRDIFDSEKHEKKLKNLIPALEKCSIEKVTISFLPRNHRCTREPATAVVYCDTSQLSRQEINSLTLQNPRDYQVELFTYAMHGNSLVFLPTGSGKTLVAAMAISCMKKLNPRKLAVFIVDRIPLAHQQAEYIKAQVSGLKVSLLVGECNGNEPSMMKNLNDLAEKKTEVLVLTHQIFLNMLSDEHGAVQLSDVCLLVIDEAHHCQGNHPFNQIMRDHYPKLLPDKFKPLVLALTASPAGEIGQKETLESLQGLLKRLCSSARMPVKSQDLAMHTNKPQTFYKVIPLTSYQLCLQTAIEKYLKTIASLLVHRYHANNAEIAALSPQTPNYRGCLRQITGQCHDDENWDGYALSELAMHLLGVLEINNVLGINLAIECLQECFDLIDNESTPTERRKKRILQREGNFDEFKTQVKTIQLYSSFTPSQPHEKFSYLVEELKMFSLQTEKDGTSRGIVFVNMRKTAHKFCELLHSFPDIGSKLNPKPFVGHGDGGTDGMEWLGEQQVTLKHFRSGRTKLLVSTSVLEEGLDVPVCNLVIRFDSLPSLRSHVQSRGRASRRANSKFILVFSESKRHTDALLVTEKERNMEQSMRILHNTSERQITQAIKFACEARKPLLNVQRQSEPKPVRSEPEHRYSPATTPSVKVSVHIPIKTVGITELHSAIKFFSENFKTKEMNTAKEAGNHTRASQFDLEHDEHESSREEFVEHITLSWCERGNNGNAVLSETWLEHLEGTRRKRTVDVDVLPAESFSIGYFRRRTSFCQQWPIPQGQELRSIRVVFQHDLKTLLILFTVHEPQSTDLYEIEIHYNELQRFILVDRKREYSDVFLSLKHSPKLYKTPQGASWEAMVNEVDVQDDVDSDDDSGFDETRNGEHQIDDDFDHSSDEDRDRSDEGYDSNVLQDENIIHTGENSESAFSHPILATLDEITKWCRVPGIADSEASFGRCLSYVLRVSNTDLGELLPNLRSCDKDVYFAKVTEQHRPLQEPSEVHIQPGLDQDVRYNLHCLLSNYPSLLGRISANFSLLLSGQTKTAALAGLEKLTKIVEQDFFCQPEETLHEILQTPNLRSRRFTVKHIPSHCALVKRLVMTPTRRLFAPEEIMQNNRVLRNFDPSNFVCVNIRDEDFSKLSGSSGDLSVVLVYLKRIFDQGIEVCGDRYSFLGCSNSQLRSHSCWFVKASANPDDIRKWMGDFSSIRCVGSYVSRMGQCFSTSLDAVGVSIDQGVTWSSEQDVKYDKYCFSDGVGRISQDLAIEVVKKIGKKFNPSAFQIRFAGYKGVLAVDSLLSGKKAYFRQSMRKFESSHRRLEVLATSRPQAVYLNHQVIMLLSNLGIPDVVFVKLMREALDNLTGMLLDERRAVLQLYSSVKTGIEFKNLSEAGVSLTVEPFFRSVIAAVYYDHLHSLLTKARIKLDPRKARLMMGVMDETGVLQYGQVFVQYSECSNDPKTHEDFNLKKRSVLQGPVMVTRNPCLHPGDMRRLVAVDTPELRHLVDCVVFPRVGPRPHPNEMAGGDLDGDLYFVSWRQDLLSDPEKELFTPMDYDAPPKKQIPRDVTPADMTEFLMNYIRSDQLGIIDNAHKAHADLQAQGIESKKCLLLAEAHSLAVDAPKTGCWPAVSSRDLKVAKCPDFMMKTDKPSYKSGKVLGKLYRACRALKRNTEQSPDIKPRSVIDGSFAVPEYKIFLEKARSQYSKYSDTIQQLMSSYGIASEAELVSGCFRKLYKRLSRERTEVAEIVGRLVEDVRMKFRKRFFKEFLMDGSRHKPQQLINRRIHQKAYAWYYVAYAEETGTHGARFLSFPWIVDDVMVSIRAVKKRSTRDVSVTCPQPKVNDVTQSLITYLREDKDKLITEYKRRLSGRNQITKQIKGPWPNLQIAAFGSTATFLFREDSDVDLCFFYNVPRPQMTKKEQLKLLRSFKPVLCKLFTNVRLVDRAKVPVISCKKFKPYQVPGFSLDVPFDVSASRDGLDKAIVVSCYIMSDPPLLAVMRFLVSWAHVSGLTGHGKRMIANSNALIFMFLSHCVNQGHVQELSDDVIQNFYRRPSYDCLSEWENVLNRAVDHAQGTPSLRGTSLGEVLIQFFASHVSIVELRIPHSISKLVKAKTIDELLNPSSLTLLQEHFQRAYHVIVLYGDLDCLLRLSGAEKRHVVHLSTGLSNAMKGAERENARGMQERTGAQVRIRSKGSSVTYRLIVEAKGTEIQIEAVDQILQDMTRTTSALRAAFMSMCFVKGASQILFESSRNNSEAVTLVPYHSYHHPQHDGTRLYTPMLASRWTLRGPSLTVSNHVFNSFKQKFITQFNLAARDHEESLHGVMEFVVRFGRTYIFRVPKSFIEDPESVTIERLQANLNRGYKATQTRKGRPPKPNLAISDSGVTRKAKRSRKKRQKQEHPKVKKDKKMNEKPCRSSYFTNIRSKEAAEKFLQTQRFNEVERFEDYDVIIKGDDELSVKFDEQLHFQELRFTPLRWCLTDVKRRWKEKKNAKEAGEDGDEIDIRFLLQSRRSLTRNEILGTEYEVYEDIMQTTTPHSRSTKKQMQLFRIQEDLWHQVYMVRHKKTQRFRNLFPSNDKFNKSLFIDLTEVTEYSRPLSDCSSFRKVFTRHEMNLQLETPSLSADERSLSEFLYYVWRLAFNVSDFLSI